MHTEIFKKILFFSSKYDWKIKNISEEEIMFVNAEAALNINFKKFVITTMLVHPKWGKTELVRTGQFSLKVIESIFRNPRKHMPKTVKSTYVSEIIQKIPVL